MVVDWNFTTGDQWLVKTQGTEKQGYNWNKKFKKQDREQITVLVMFQNIVRKGMTEGNIYEQYAARKRTCLLPSFNRLLEVNPRHLYYLKYFSMYF